MDKDTDEQKSPEEEEMFSYPDTSPPEYHPGEPEPRPPRAPGAYPPPPNWESGQQGQPLLQEPDRELGKIYPPPYQ